MRETNLNIGKNHFDGGWIRFSLQEDFENMTTIINNYTSNTLPIEQNKYTLLNEELNKYFIPFDLINEENTDGIIIEKNVAVNLNTVIDNFEDMYSSVFSSNNIRNRRFVIQKYNLGSSKLDTVDATSSRLITTRVKMTNPDTMSIKSFITLPEPTIRFSRINLPGSSLLDKANLNQVFLNYWEFLKKKTLVKDVKGMQITFQIQYMNEKYWLQKLSLVRIKLRIRANLGQSKGVFSSEQGRI